jgi:hypothetical protein
MVKDAGVAGVIFKPTLVLHDIMPLAVMIASKEKPGYTLINDDGWYVITNDKHQIFKVLFNRLKKVDTAIRRIQAEMQPLGYSMETMEVMTSINSMIHAISSSELAECIANLLDEYKAIETVWETTKREVSN